MRILLTIIGFIAIIYGISCFLQSFRHLDSSIALMRDGIFEHPKKTSRRLRLMAFFFVTVGVIVIMMFF